MTPLSIQSAKTKSVISVLSIISTLPFLHIHSQHTSQIFIFFSLNHYSSLLSGLSPPILAPECFSYQSLYSICSSYAEILSVIKRRQYYPHITTFVSCLAKNIFLNLWHTWLLLLLIKSFYVYFCLNLDLNKHLKNLLDSWGKSDIKYGAEGAKLRWQRSRETWGFLVPEHNCIEVR